MTIPKISSRFVLESQSSMDLGVPQIVKPGRQHAQKFGEDRACGSGDILADRKTNTQWRHITTRGPLDILILWALA